VSPRTEAELLTQVIELASLTGWLVHHDRPALDRRGRWATHVQGRVGFPDLLLVKEGVVWAWELKGPKGRATAEQLVWLAGFGDRGRLLRPADWPWIESALKVKVAA